ncbi:hypothetical protein OXT66_05665 [Lentilactobacillus senioris]|uniref:hypothetical protein n=1 Tax=Lentilactobacillus senioris TaxID=931534 RepID=UPI0022818A0E|nr:hypothetical protein [Lentilactobacillus senioris]MCY9807037.1 hypothetical protein [Lentilactobacillus senioris]
MDEQNVIDRITRNPQFKFVDPADIIDAVADAKNIVSKYEWPGTSINRALYLYACNLLFKDLIQPKNKFKTVKIEDASYSRSDDADKNHYWDDFLDLLNEFGYTNTVTGFC